MLGCRRNCTTRLLYAAGRGEYNLRLFTNTQLVVNFFFHRNQNFQILAKNHGLYSTQQFVAHSFHLFRGEGGGR